MAEYSVGTIVLSVDGQEYDCSKFGAKKSTGVKPLPTMKRLRKVKFVSKGIVSHELTASVVIPEGRDAVDWMTVEEARISVESPEGGFRETYIDCYVTEVSDAYDVNGETTRDLSLLCLDFLKESM